MKEHLNGHIECGWDEGIVVVEYFGINILFLSIRLADDATSAWKLKSQNLIFCISSFYVICMN